MKHAVKHIHFVGPPAASRAAFLRAEAFADDADEGQPA